MSPHRPARRQTVVALLALVAALLAPALARGADRIYWSNFGAPERISFANLDGTGGTDLNTAGATIKVPIGVALDPVGGRIYWTNQTALPPKISFANLDGSGGAGDFVPVGTTPNGPMGPAIDTVARRIYWANSNNDTIGWASLVGGAGGLIDTTGATVDEPGGVAIVPSLGRVYWTNFGGDSIAYANLDGSGGGTLAITGTATVQNPLGLAIDPAASKIYWANDDVPGSIGSANLDGSGSANLNIAGATAANPYGVALDLDAGRAYWANSSGGISFTALNGSGGQNLNVPGGFTSGAPNFPVLLKSPRNLAPPRAGGGATAGSSISCVQGEWAPDVVSAFLYRAPVSYAFQWFRDGALVPGATSSELQASSGAYRCAVTASNQAGSVTSNSGVHAVFTIGKAKRNPKKGIVRVPVTLPVAGRLTVTGAGLAAVVDSGRKKKKKAKSSLAKAVPGPQTIKLIIRAKGKKLKKLKKKGKAKGQLTYTFVPAEGTSGSQALPVTLRKK